MRLSYHKKSNENLLTHTRAESGEDTTFAATNIYLSRPTTQLNDLQDFLQRGSGVILEQSQLFETRPNSRPDGKSSLDPYHMKYIDNKSSENLQKNRELQSRELLNI